MASSRRIVPDLDGGKVEIVFDGTTQFLPGDHIGKPVVDENGHLWIVIVGYMVDPTHDQGPIRLTADNVLHTTPPGCYFCEQSYEMAKEVKCPGDAEDMEFLKKALGLS
jgi:hypothetical protein